MSHAMDWAIGVALVAGALVLGAGALAAHAQPEAVPGDPLRVVVHINFPEGGRQSHGLKNVANLLKELGDEPAVVEVVCHGAGITTVETARTESAELVAQLQAQGVRFVACRNTMKSKSIEPADLLPGVDTVASGIVEVVRKQQEGYSYFKP